MPHSNGPTARFIETRERGLVGWFFLGLFWLWQIVALAGPFLAGDASPEELLRQEMLSAEDANAELAIGLVLWFAVWAIGSVVFGAMAYFSRGRKVLVQETI